MAITTQKHINIIEELKERAIKDKAQLNGALLPSEKDRFTTAINGLEATKKRMQIDLLQQEKENVENELDKLNA